MNKKVVIIISSVILLIVIGIGVFWFMQSKKPAAKNEVEKIHIHAAFEVYIDGQLQDYSASKFMIVEPCRLNDNTDSANDPAAEQEEKAHLHDHIGDIVHVERKGATWGDLFTNINIKFPAEKEIIVYANGQKIESDILTTEINAYDRVLILIDDNTDIDAKLQKVPSTDRIKEIEQKSETCGVS